MHSRAIVLILVTLLAPSLAHGQACPSPLNDAKRLVLVTTEKMDSTPATMQWFERTSVED